LPTLSPSADVARPRLCAAILLLALLSLPTHLSSAAIVVDDTCSLADAIRAANADSPSGGCPAGSGADELQLTGDVLLTEALPPITTDITVSGDEFAIERSAAAPPFRIFDVFDGAFALDSVQVSNGDAEELGGGAIRLEGGTLTLTDSKLSSNSSGSGGAIYAYAPSLLSDVLLVNSTISGNTAAVNGGGIANFGERVTLVNSHVYGNTAAENGGGIRTSGLLYVTEGSSITHNVASENGGGIRVREDGSVFVTDSSVSYNMAGVSGGGVYMPNANGSYTTQELTIDNSTLAGNHAGSSGGALTLDVGYVHACDCQSIEIENSTISGNTALVSGGGIKHNTGLIILRNTTMTQNSAPEGAGVELAAFYDFQLIGSIVAGNPGGENCGGGNGLALVEESFDDDGSCGSAAAIVPGVDFDTELEDNGGPTATHALLTHSVAIDAAGDCFPVVTDQRGFAREVGACDSGAFEFGVGPFPLSLVGECPGTVTASVVAAVPGSVVDLVGGEALGASQVPAGPCQGTPLELGNPRLLAAFVTDENGEGAVAFDVAAPSCGQFLQAVDRGDCDVSTTQTIDSCHELTFVHAGLGSDPIPSLPGSPGCPEGEYLPGTVVDLTAIPDLGWSVGSWSGTDDDMSMSEMNTVTMPVGDRTVGVNYVLPCSQLRVGHTGSGADPTPSPFNSPGCPVREYAAGESITLTASPAEGWAVSGWSGTDDDLSTELTNTLTFPGQPHAVDVLYVPLCFDLTLSHSGSGGDPLATPLGAGLAWDEGTVDSFFDGASSVYAADVDGDGDLDALAAGEDVGAINWYENTLGDGSAWLKHLVGGGFGLSQSVYAADVDGDGDTDVLGTSVLLAEIAWWENTLGDGSVWAKHIVNSDFVASPYSVHATDVDGDGDTDVLGAAFGGDEISWWENTLGDGTEWIERIIAPFFEGAISVWAADVDGDGDNDVLGAAWFDNAITWWENTLGDGTAWAEHVIDDDFGVARRVRTADIDGDGDTDVLGASLSDRDGIAWWENTLGDGSTWIDHPVDKDFPFVASVDAADIDGDGDYDVVGASQTFDDVLWWENTLSDGTDWVERTVDGSFDGAKFVYVADLDADGAADVLGAAEDGNQVAWWRNTYVPQCPSGSYILGERFALQASPDPGWEVAGWTGTDDDSSTETTNTATMPANAHEISVDYLSMDPLQLEISGTCPGEITIAVAGVSPSTNVSFITSDLEGVFVKPQPPCQGLELGLAAPDLLTSVPADANGNLMLTPDVSLDVCGKFVQAVEIDSCSVSEVAQIP